MQTIRVTTGKDREPILAFIREIKRFRENEIAIADEVLSDAIAKGPEGHYKSFAIEEDDRVMGWVCGGATPCTENTWDIYWLVVAPHVHRRGLGKRLMDYIEKVIVERNGRMAVVETSGRSDYAEARRFYLKVGYIEVARVPDFYAPGDDRIIFAKRMQPA